MVNDMLEKIKQYEKIITELDDQIRLFRLHQEILNNANNKKENEIMSLKQITFDLVILFKSIKFLFLQLGS